MLVRLIEFSTLFAASVAGVLFYWDPQINQRWRPALKWAMRCACVLVVLSEFLLKGLTGKGWEDRTADLASHAFCAVKPSFSLCLDRAITELNKSIEDDPHDPGLLVGRGNAFLRRSNDNKAVKDKAVKDLNKAIQDFDDALSIEPELAVAYARRAYAYRAKGDRERAIADIKRATELDPQFTHLSSDFALSSDVAKGDRERAFADIKHQQFPQASDIRPPRWPLRDADKDRVPLDMVLSYAAAPPAPVPAGTAPASIAFAPLDRDEIAAMLMRARTFLSSGDVAAARVVMRRAAERGDPQAALALGGTYDPNVLKRLGITSFHADPAQAREWYRKAAALGSADASIKLEQLVPHEEASHGGKRHGARPGTLIKNHSGT